MCIKSEIIGAEKFWILVIWKHEVSYKHRTCIFVSIASLPRQEQINTSKLLYSLKLKKRQYTRRESILPNSLGCRIIANKQIYFTCFALAHRTLVTSVVIIVRSWIPIWNEISKKNFWYQKQIIYYKHKSIVLCLIWNLLHFIPNMDSESQENNDDMTNLFCWLILSNRSACSAYKYYLLLSE